VKAYWIIGIIIIIILIIFFYINFFIFRERPTELDFYSCYQDTDCIRVAGGCCNCNSGGTATSINKYFETEWNDKLSRECAEIGCPAVMSDHPSCFKEAKCIDNKCVLQ
jgi:Na+/melibiose symporter-like transporter